MKKLSATKTAVIIFATILLSGCASTFKEDLYSKAQAQMLEVLKVPSTAEFSPEFEVKKFVLKKDPDNIFNICGIEVPLDEALPSQYATDKYEEYYEVYFWADAENSYGAKLRTDYTCLIDLADNVSCQSAESAESIKEDFCS